MPELYPIKAYAYLRVSGRGQVDGLGFDRQLQEIDEYASVNDMEIVEVFREEGVSGTRGEQERPAFMEMVSRILANGVRTIVVEGMDRLARENRVQENLIVFLASKGITLISARTGVDVTADFDGDPVKKAMIQIQGIFSEMERNLIVKKLKQARDKKRERTGKCEGQKSFTESEQGKITVRELVRLRESGFTWQEVADHLNTNGFFTKSGKPWTMVNAQQTWRNNREL